MVNKIYHLKIEEDSIEDFYIAVHSPLEAHQLAFYINKKNKVLLERKKKDLKNKKKEGSFSFFEWEDLLSQRKCQLISNKFIQESYNTKAKSYTLFELPERNEVYLISEFKQADFFIKSNYSEIIKTIQIQLNNWSMVSISYNIFPKNKTLNELNI
jgi:hypothetical protein